jgi:glycopeptide antibiotics resistance protein
VLSVSVAGALLTMTTWPASGAQRAGRSVQWVPLRTVLAELDNPDVSLAVINLAGNVAVFVPLGLCLRMALRRASRPALTALLLGAAVSVLAELLQLASGTRTTDVDDVLLNVLGVALGLCPASRSAARMAGWDPPAAQDR